MLRYLSIRSRLTYGYIVILVLTVAISSLAVFEINKIFNDTKSLYERPYKVSNLLREIKINTLNMRRYMLDITILQDNKEIDQLIHLINTEEQEAFASIKQISSLSPEDMELNKTEALLRNWKPLRDDVITLVRRGDKDRPNELIINRNRDYVANMFNQMQGLIDTTSRKADAFYKSAEHTKEKVLGLFILVLFSALIISILLAYYITKSISDPLASIVENIKEIAKGNVNNKRLPEENDEIGQLSTSFNIMQDNLLHKAQIAERIAKGDFAARVNSSGEKDIVGESINLIARNFNMVVTQAQRVAAGNFGTELVVDNNPLTVALNQMLQSLKEVVVRAKQVAAGDYSGQIIPKSSSDELALSLNQMTQALRYATEQNNKQSRLKTAQNDLNECMRGDLTIEEIANNVISYISNYAHAQIGGIYLFQEELHGYNLMGSFAYTAAENTKTFFKPGEGLVGQTALEKHIITCKELPADYVKVTSGIGDTPPKCVILAPLTFEGKAIGVLELGTLTDFTLETYEFLNMVKENIAIFFLSAINRVTMAKLLETSMTQAEELQVQQEELREINEELEIQTQALKKSEEFLQTQQEELRIINEQLEEKTRRLEEQKVQVERQNQDLESARADIEKKAIELEITNRYKSEFLANMSHELRTPLNSLLILSQNLMENRENNLSAQQIESARIIFNSGNDLLNLINDILDLAKIESGKMNISTTHVDVSKIKDSLKDYFQHIIDKKNLQFEITIANDVPEKVVTDEQRLNQILRNLMSNAVKFTEKGGIYMNMYKPATTEKLSRSNLDHNNTLAIAVKDTGIGIPADKQMEIFQAFQQVDGSISRKYGGTGLGLSITRELTKMLGGEIKLVSEPGKGSEFTVYLPFVYTEKQVKDNTTSVVSHTIPRESFNIPLKENLTPKKTQPPFSIADDRESADAAKNCILIIEDDPNFAETLAKLCKEKKIKHLSAVTGEEGIELANKFLPKGIILDINLPGMNGWDVLEHLKNSPETRHIPVHFMSVYEESIEAYSKGVFGYLTKPVSTEKLETTFSNLQLYINRKIKELLIVEDDDNLRSSTKMLLEAQDIRITECNNAKEAIAAISGNHYDCVVLDLGLPDMSGIEMLKILKDQNIKIPPVVIYTGKEITPEENLQLQQYTRNIILKGARSEERLLDETALFLHRVIDDLPERQKKMLVNLYDKDEMFRDKTVLLVDDDMRNVFAITQVLQLIHMKVLMAPNGKKAIDILRENEMVDLILMDIMMPVMDGYEAMQLIRKNKQWYKIPIIALTAKAMKEDREKSLAAGASDYMSKPIDVQKLFNLMRIWLYQ
ncbi:MAG TPA: response regulator [Bacteroidales bacterium]|nr:response regulator [Bacteroidales bacterium]